ncbi:trichohyalin-like [Acanthochromis polyacanthus]|uniref:trichohyalin-like n=1 Tax=Acanthochromis polyacanthus TaxID=80966 RepID=UPI0022349EDA|nr:trichohyalin-like [Acanthochromis polyacanthus]
MPATSTPESGENSKVSREGSETLNLPSPSGQTELEAADQYPGIDANNIKQLINEFEGLYKQRLKCLEVDAAISREERQQKKVDFLQSYVNDLTDQNQVLAETIEDLQREARHKVSSYGMKLHSSDHDLNVSEVNLKTLLLDELMGPMVHIPHSTGSLVQIASESEDLEIQLQTKDIVISELGGELRENLQQNQKTATQVLESTERLVHLQSELSCLQRIHKDNMKEIAEKDICITKLQANIQLLKQEGADTHAQLSKLNVRTKELQEELKGKEEKWRQCEEEQKMKDEKESEKVEERRRHERQKREEWMKREEEWKKRTEEDRKAYTEAVQKWAEKEAILNSEMKEREDRVRHLEQDAVTLRATQDSLMRALAMKEKHSEQLVQCNAQLKESLATLQSKIQKKEIKLCALARELTEHKKQLSECQKELLRREKALEKLREETGELRAKMEDHSRECVHLNQTKDRLEADLALSHEKLHTSHLEVRSRDQLILQLRAEMKTAEQKHQGTQEQVTALVEEARHLNHKVRAHEEEACQLNEKLRGIEHLKDQKETEQQQLYDQLQMSQQQVETFKEKLMKQEADMEFLHHQLKGAKGKLKETNLQNQGQKETVAIFKQKYTVAIEKVQRVQGQVELLEEELRYSQQQLKDSQSAAHSIKEELAELERRYQEKVGQWESSQEALDQLADELQANQNLLRESQQNADHFKSLMGSLQEQVDTFKQQKLTVERDLRLYQQSHSHSDEEYLSLSRLRQQLQKRCTEQVERLAECEKAILQMKSELERQTQENVGLKQTLAASHHKHLCNRSELEDEVAHLKKEVTCFERELADTQKVQVTVRRQAEELKEATRDSARMSREVDVHKGEVQRLQEELQKEEEKMRRAIRENQSLSFSTRQLMQELKELRNKHQVAVEELAARAEEARRMEGCLNEGKLAEEKIRSMAARLEKEVTELRRNLQQAVDQKLKAEREKQDAQDQVKSLRSELEGTRSDNLNLRHESQLVMTNVSLWITEQKASNESLAAQMKAQNKVLLIVTEEKEHLQEANDTLKAEVKRLKEVADEKERDMERFKAQIRDRGIRQDGKTMERKGCVALNLSKIEDLQTRLQGNLEAIGMLNQQLNALSGENKRLRRQLEEERSMRRQVVQLLPPPPTSQRCSSIHLPLSHRAQPPPSASLPSSLCLPRPLGPETRDPDGILSQTKLSRAGSERPGEFQALGEAFRIRPTAECAVSTSLEDVWSGRTSRHLAK